jgi:sulfite exporter TauE/SafE
MADLDRGPTTYGEWRRLSGAALLPYHLGRLTTYAGLGALAGAATALFASTSVFGWLSGGLLVVAACLMIVQALGLAFGRTSPLAGVLTRLAAPLSMARGNAARYGLGVVLGFLPCGLLYGALAAAGGTGSAIDGALAMAAFAVGTMPALVATAWGGLLVRRRLRERGRWVATPLLIGNAGLMLLLASQRL